MLKCWKILILLFCFCTSILAQTLKPPFSSDRFYQLPSPELMPRGQFQIESGFLFEKDRPGDAYLNSVNHNTSLIRYGLSEEIEVRRSPAGVKRDRQHACVVKNIRDP
jgi:hypothetical protein